VSTVTVYSAVTDGSTTIDITSATFATITGLSVTVLNTVVGDVLFMSAVIPDYTDGAASLIRYGFLVDGALQRSALGNHYSKSDGDVTPKTVEWAITLGAGDITGGNTIVALQAAKYNSGQGTIHIYNGSDAIATLQVIHVRT